MKTSKKIPRIQSVSKVEGFRVYCLFNTGEKRVINFEQLFQEWAVKPSDVEHVLLNLHEFQKVKLHNGVLSWDNVKVKLLDENRKEQEFPYEIDPLILYQNSASIRHKRKVLFEKFLTNRRVYALNERYWKRQMQKFSSSIMESNDWYQAHFANGKKIYDGNPIYSALLKDHKSLRIIQKEPESDQPEIRAWVHQTEADGEQIHELVISMELSKVTSQVAIEFIAKWCKGKTGVLEMEDFITERLKTLKSTILPSTVLSPEEFKVKAAAYRDMIDKEDLKKRYRVKVRPQEAESRKKIKQNIKPKV